MLLKDVINKKKQEAAKIMEARREREEKIKNAERAAISGRSDLNAVMKFYKPELERELGAIEKMDDGHWRIADTYDIKVYHSESMPTLTPEFIIKRYRDTGFWKSYGRIDAKKHEYNADLIKEALCEIADALIDKERYMYG